MSLPIIKYCPGTLAEGFSTYSRTCMKRVFYNKKVHHILPYTSPNLKLDTNDPFDQNRKRMSISGVQEKFSIIMDRNKLRLSEDKEQSTHILKPIPLAGNRADQMPANEHLTMQIARQVYGIETAENALIFFADGAPAYITKRFDIRDDGSKWAQEDFASLGGRTPQTHGEHYKYLGNYSDLFDLMTSYLPAYIVESMKLYKLLIFNYLFSNGDAHYKNFSVLETNLGDFRLSPAYDLLNSKIHVDDRDFALDDGLLPRDLGQGKIQAQFRLLAEKAGIKKIIVDKTMALMLSKSDKVEKMISVSYLNEKTKRNYLQTYQRKLKNLSKE